ncbi:MAG: 4-hydroxybenzoate octaprenyltransferase [Gammaproteobacteria bacterium]|nr:4-hydroxybenzoate octaprenyltransferase [Gammaproteobacteria bacterium]
MVWLKKRWLACLGICRQWRDFVTLARFDRPIGIYLLLWPTLWGLWLAADGWPGWHLFLVFTLGCVLTRSAGCVANDLWDRDFDHRVERTRERPITTGKITHRQAILFMGLLLLLALALVLTTNRLTIYLSLGAVFIAGVYPLMKRITHMPQAVLGIAFSWGIPMAFAATQHHIPHTAWLLVVANLLWTIAYDTQYAMVDREDDLKIGLKSSAILFGDLDKVMVGILQAAFVITMLVVGYRFELGFWFHLGLVIATCLMLYQQFLIRERERNACFRAFLNNHWAGFAIFLGIVCELYLKTPA